MIVLDAGVLIGLLEPADLHHDAAVALVTGAPAPLMLHTLTLAEVLVGPARAGREREARADMEGIGVQVADLGAREALLLARLRADHRLKMPDTCVLATAVALGVPLATYDAKLAGVAGALGLLVDALS